MTASPLHHARANRPAGARPRQGERGAVIVEFALIMPILAMLLFGMISGGLVMNRRMEVSQASREGARYGATVPFDQCTPVANCGGRNWAQQVRSVAVTRSDGAITAADVCVALVQGPGTAPVPISTAHSTTGQACYADRSADTGRRVQVVITFSDKIEAVVTSVSINATARSTSRLES